MTRRFLAALAVAAAACGTTLATSIRYTPVPERVATADLVVVGTVTEVEEKASDLEASSANKTVKLKIARVRVTERLFGGDGADAVRVAFVAKEDQPNDGLRIPTPVLAKGNEVVLFLQKRRGEEVYRVPGYFGAVGQGVGLGFPGSLKDVAAEARAAGKVLANAPAALKSKDDEERMLAAYLLTVRYRSHPFERNLGKTRQVEIGAEESRAILEGLYLMADRNRDGFWAAAYSLNLTREDGFESPLTPERVKEWLGAHKGTYRIKKHVMDKE